MYTTIQDRQTSVINQQVLDKLSETIDPKMYDNMFAGDSFELRSLTGGTATFVVDSDSNAKIINMSFLPRIKAILNEITETNYEVEIVDRNSFQKRKAAIENAQTTFFQNSKLQSQYTFDNFVTGPSNKDAYLASKFSIDRPGISNPIFIYSKSGMGKTHLLHAVGNQYKTEHPGSRVLYITSDDFVSEFVRFVKGNKDSESLKDFFSTIDLLLVDDIQFLANKEETQVMFFHVFNLLVSNRKQIVLTSDRAPSELRGLQERLVSRFSGGLSVSIQNPRQETLIEILELKLGSYNLDTSFFEEGVLNYLACNYSKNVRELEGALTRLLFAVTIQRPELVTLDFTRAVFEEDETKKARSGKVDIDKIIDTVADYYSLTASQLKSKVKTSQIALARQIAMYLSRTMLNLTYQEIGREFSKDHTTVLANVQKIESQLKTDASLRKAVDELKQLIGKK